jgi:sialidase-1
VKVQFAAKHRSATVNVLFHRTLYCEERFHAAFPSIVKFSDDNLLLAFRRARDAHWLLPEKKRKDIDLFNRMDHMDSRSHIVLLELSATGQTQVGDFDMLPVDPEAGDQDSSLLILPDDNVFLAAFSWYPLPVDASKVSGARTAPGENANSGKFLYWGSHSALRGRASGQWKFHHRYLLPAGDYARALSPDGSKQVVGPVRGQPVWRNNEILLPLYGDASEGCRLFVSRDRGESWHYRGLIARDESARVTYQEPALCEDGDGGLICFMRTAGANGRLATSHTKDGIHWSEPRLHQLVGHPFHPLLLDDGRVLLSYGFRDKPYGIRARLLDNPLHDPDEVDEIVIRDDGLCPDIGYPWAVELQDGRILMSYYWTDSDGTRHIAGSWLELLY